MRKETIKKMTVMAMLAALSMCWSTQSMCP